MHVTRRLLVAGGALLWATAAGAATPTLTDIAACNEEAAARTSASALPAPPGPGPRPRAQAPIVQGERDLPRQAGGEKSDPTGSVVAESPDPLATGMDAQRASDPAYRAAYRECLKGRLGGGR